MYPPIPPPRRATRAAGTILRSGALLLALLFAGGPAVPARSAPEALPGFNVHFVREHQGRRFWRGGAPRVDTLEALAAAARPRGVPVTVFDLRSPANADDRSGKQGRLSPDALRERAEQLGIRYVSISAMAEEFPTRARAAFAEGDVYVHCMYGVNRTGFAMARYARVSGAVVGREGLGARDWQQGERYQQRLDRRKKD